MVVIDIPLGAVAYDKSGIGYRVVEVFDDVVTLEKPDRARLKAN
ncbi:hypothetical protein [Synechococcus sp. PCC 6312]|nr:hypothetical protein [Synechococcus sp. PCC 6312]AFY61207.1 hypothetical protein Syn6312_2082 [Synechococcus sp. PCC 6312]